VISTALAKDMLTHRAAGQLQQRPAAREGEILKRHWWRFYDPKLFRDEKLKTRRPKFRVVVQSVDTPLKDKESNDLVAIQAWGGVKADKYLLDLKKGHMNYSQAKRAVLEQAKYVRKLYPHSAHYILIENAGYGVELVLELKREITGVVKVSRGGDGDKILRAESACADLESGNCYLPGFRMGSDEFSMPDETRCPADIVDFVDSCAIFPNGRNDDDVDAWSQCMNWLRARTTGQARTFSSFRVKR
jgi:phage terminase large subunit-like protein